MFYLVAQTLTVEVQLHNWASSFVTRKNETIIHARWWVSRQPKPAPLHDLVALRLPGRTTGRSLIMGISSDVQLASSYATAQVMYPSW